MAHWKLGPRAWIGLTMSDYCHLCDTDPCMCGQHGNVTPIPAKKVASHGGPHGIDEEVRKFVLNSHDDGVRENWDGWLDLLTERFGPDRDAVRNAWSRVNNGLQRDWLLIDDPDGDGPKMPPSHYPQVRRLSKSAAIAEVEQLIVSGGWTVDEPGLRLWQVWRRIPNTVYICIYDALHDMNGRDYLVTTTAPSGKSSQFWYVKP